MNPNELKQHWNDVMTALKSDPSLIEDKMWRLEHFYIINTKLQGKKVFKLTRAQRHFLQNLKPRNVILKARQLGFSTLITIWILDEILWTPDRESLSVAHIKQGMTDIFDKKAKFAIQNFPEWLKRRVNIVMNSKTQLKIAFGTEQDSFSAFSVALSGRSGMNHYVHVSELGKMSKMFPARAEEVVSGTLPSVPHGGRAFVESTAEGATGIFYDMFMGAVKTKAKDIEALYQVEFYPHFYNWTWDDMQLDLITPDQYIPIIAMEKNNDIDWAEYQMMHNLSDREMTYYYKCWISCQKKINILNQEYPTTIDEAFVSTGKPYFDIRKVIDNKQKLEDPESYEVIGNKVMKQHGGSLSVWEPPVPNRTYVVGGDVAEGLSNGDYSTLSVIDVESRKICALYQNHIPPDEFHEVASAVGNWYNTALLAVEVNKDGLWVNNELERSGYPNLYYRQRIDDVTKTVTKTFGWLTGRNTRDTMLTEMRSVFTDHDFVQEHLLDEMQAFVRNSKGKPEAVYPAHDDLIMATAIAYMVRKLWYVEGFRNFAGNAAPSSHMDIIFGGMS